MLFSGHLLAGSSECVEMLLDDVLVEMSGHRGLGRIFITNFRYDVTNLSIFLPPKLPN